MFNHKPETEPLAVSSEKNSAANFKTLDGLKATLAKADMPLKDQQAGTAFIDQILITLKEHVIKEAQKNRTAEPTNEVMADLLVSLFYYSKIYGEKIFDLLLLAGRNPEKALLILSEPERLQEFNQDRISDDFIQFKTDPLESP